MFWQTTRYRIELTSPKVMGIVNVTPDSFSDAGAHSTTEAALAHCKQLLEDGADMLDIGGESTRPGSQPVSIAEELGRVMPVLSGAMRLGIPISVDTSKAEVMTAVLAQGADIINDINALRANGAIDAVAAHASCGICLMHMRGTPDSMQLQPHYDDVLDEVRAFLRSRAAALIARRVSEDRIVFDPGIGFGKSAEHNVDLLRRQSELLELGRPLLLGWSRKSTLGKITGRDVDHRTSASVAAALAAVLAGASIVRVHDVAATVDALSVWRAAGLLQAQGLHT
jgi:dihydropteroate synthase